MKKNKGYQHVKNLTFPSGSFTTSQLVQLPKGDWEVRMLGNHQFRRVFSRPEKVQLQSKTIYQSALPKYWPDSIFQGDLNADGKPDLILLEQMQFHMFEILDQKEGEWTSALHFPVFETASGAKGQRGGNSEPRETRLVDVNGDGLEDMIMLVHDRLLLYLQGKIPPVADR